MCLSINLGRGGKKYIFFSSFWEHSARTVYYLLCTGLWEEEAPLEQKGEGDKTSQTSFTIKTAVDSG